MIDAETWERILDEAQASVGRTPSQSLPSTRGLGPLLVEQFMAQVQAALPGRDPLPQVRQLYIDLLTGRFGWSGEAARQSWASVSGNSFQGTVRYALNGELGPEGIRAVSVGELGQYPSHIRTFLTLPARRRCVQASFEAWPDNDIMLLTRSRTASPTAPVQIVVFGILSCKTSFHARETESCFWALATRDTGIRMGLVTQDRDGELGTCVRPTKARMLLEAYFDRVFTTNPTTSLCGQIRPFEDLFEDARRWRRDVAPDHVSEPWT